MCLREVRLEGDEVALFDEEVLLPEDRRRNDLPYELYGLSGRGRRFLEEHKLLRAEETLRAIYDRVEKTDEIERYENAPRPEH